MIIPIILWRETDQTPHTANGSDLTWNWAEYYSDDDYANFDVKYRGEKTTYSNGGWCTEYKIDDVQYWTRIHGYDFGESNWTDDLGTVQWKTIIERPLGPNYLLIKFNAKVIGDEPRRLNLACFADVMIKQNDFATVKWYGSDERRGLTMRDDGSDYTLTLLAKNGFGVTNYDSFWYGRWSGSYRRHQLENRIDQDDLTNTDSAFSVGWKDRVVYGGQEFNFTILMGVGEDLQDPPVITIEDNFLENYAGGEHIVINGSLRDYNENEHINLSWSIDTNPPQNGSKIMEGNYSNGIEFQIEFNLPTEIGKYNLTIQAIDKDNLTSNLFERAMLVNEPPRLTVNRESLRSKYYTGGTVEVSGTFWDDRYARLGYKFEGDYGFVTDEYVECKGSTKPFRRQFPLRSTRLSYGTHKLYIWAEDDFGVKTPEQEFTFEYIQLHAPTLQIYNATNNTHTILDYILIKGSVADQDSDETLTVWYKDPISDPTEPFQQAYMLEGTELPATVEGKEFSVIFQIPRNYPTDREISFVFQARDNREGFSRDAEYKFTVHQIPAPTLQATPTPFATPTNWLTQSNDTVPAGQTSFVTNVPSYTETNASVSEGDASYLTWTITSIPITVYAAEPPPTPFPTPTQTPPDPTSLAFAADAYVTKGNKKNEKKNSLIPIIAGAVAAVVVAAIIAGVIIWHEAAKKAKEYDFNDEDFENYQDEINDAALENTNGMYNEDGNDDPFAEEFDEQEPPEGVFSPKE